MAIEQRVLDAAAKPTKKKKRIAPKQNTGTHFAAGTVGGRLRGTAIDEMEAAAKPTVETPVRILSPERASQPSSPPASPPIKQTTAALKTTTPEKTTAGTASDSDSDGQQSYVPNSSDNDSEISSPQPKFNTRAGALLAKRPSIVHEDKEREEEEDTTPRPADSQRGLRLDTTSSASSPSPASRAGKGNGRGQALASAAFAQERQHGRSASQPAPAPAASDPALIPSIEGGARGVRVHSVSPARTTHFAPVPDQLAVKHSPPPRAVSPRKSALKHHSSDSPRGQSPASGVHFGYGSNASEGSTGSAGEFEEQLIPRKKSVRVSFDENNVVVGRAAGQEPFSPILQSPQNDSSSKRTWLNITGRGKKKEPNATADDDEVMQPRPTLPSFGSIRERKQTREPVEERQLVKPAEVVDGTSSIVSSTKSPLGQSNDHIVGAIISQDAASRNTANISRSREPLPPQVTSVEGSGYSSDGGSTIGRDSDDELDAGPVRGSHIPSRDINAPSNRINDVPPSGQVPEISISRATPNLDETQERKAWLDIPGGWSAGSNPNSESPDSPTSEHRAINATPATVGIAEPLPDEAQDGSPVLGHIAAENLHDHNAIGEEADESDATSIYSDAAEELSDVEGGFMSLDAVVDSPVLENRSIEIPTSTLPDSPTARGIEGGMTQLLEKPNEPITDDRWEKTQKYWGSISADKKLQLEQDAREEAEASDSTIEAPKPTPKPKKKKAASQTTTSREPQQTIHDRTYMIAPGSKAATDNYMPTMRSSMRAAPMAAPPDTHMRMSMRNQSVMRNSMREPLQTSPQKKGSLIKNRPMSVPPSSITSDATAVNTHIKALTAVAAARSSEQASLPPSLRRRGSGDSNSSFKRTRAGENTTFRRSMRGSIDSTSARGQSPAQSSRFSLRSLSPTGSGGGRRPFSAAPPPIPQNSIRTSLRSPGPSKSPKRLGGFGRASSAQPAKSKPAPKRLSRFADSSDEEDARPAFRSRFVDSSDDDEAPLPSGAGSGFGRGTMRANQPVRAIPRQAGIEDGDSSDLPDSDDEIASRPGAKLAKISNGVVSETPNQGTALASSGLRRSGSGRDAGILTSPTGASPTRSRGGNFMSILRRKKADPSSKVRKADIESAARRDTPLERSRSDLQAMKRNESYNSTGSGNSKLQKRHTVDSWPLPPPGHQAVELEAGDGTIDATNGAVGGELNNGIPVVSDQPAIATQPQFGETLLTAQSLPGAIDLNGVGKGPKKKFGMLRRMLKLGD